MKIAIVTDAWIPQINGVVRTLEAMCRELETRGHIVMMVSPDQYASIPCPSYPEIRLAFAGSRAVGRRIAAFAPDAIHISTEGPLGLAARRWCLRHALPFTTAYHTQFPDYVAKRTGLPPALFWQYIRWFHGPANATLTATPTLARELAAHGIHRTRPWGRGVDLELFRPDAPVHPALQSLPRPIQLYVGRVSVEKNLEAFLCTRHPGTRVVVGDGPARRSLETRYPDSLFLGALSGAALAGAYAAADVFVFPSRTDTFGLVMIEALACGTPVAAYSVAGPIDVVNEQVACLDTDLETAIAGALKRSRPDCASYAQAFRWSASAEQFLAGLECVAGASDAPPCQLGQGLRLDPAG